MPETRREGKGNGVSNEGTGGSDERSRGSLVQLRVTKRRKVAKK